MMVRCCCCKSNTPSYSSHRYNQTIFRSRRKLATRRSSSPPPSLRYQTRTPLADSPIPFGIMIRRFSGARRGRPPGESRRSLRVLASRRVSARPSQPFFRPFPRRSRHSSPPFLPPFLPPLPPLIPFLSRPFPAAPAVPPVCPSLPTCSESLFYGCLCFAVSGFLGENGAQPVNPRSPPLCAAGRAARRLNTPTRRFC